METSQHGAVGRRVLYRAAEVLSGACVLAPTHRQPMVDQIAVGILLTRKPVILNTVPVSTLTHRVVFE